MIDNIYCKVKHNNNQNVFSIINDAVTYSYQKSPAVLRPGFSGNGILKNDQYLGYDMMISVALSLGDTPNFFMA
jgi:hypothetical protein